MEWRTRQVTAANLVADLQDVQAFISWSAAPAGQELICTAKKGTKEANQQGAKWLNMLQTQPRRTPFLARHNRRSSPRQSTRQTSADIARKCPARPPNRERQQHLCTGKKCFTTTMQRSRAFIPKGRANEQANKEEKQVCPGRRPAHQLSSSPAASPNA